MASYRNADSQEQQDNFRIARLSGSSAKRCSLRPDKLINLGDAPFWAASKAKRGAQLSRGRVMQPLGVFWCLSCFAECFALTTLKQGSASQSDCTR